MVANSTFSQLLFSKGYSYAPVVQLAPFTYTSVVLAALLGWWFWDEALTLLFWLRIGLVFLAATVCLQLKKKNLAGISI